MADNPCPAIDEMPRPLPDADGTGLVMALQAIQRRHGYLPADALRALSEASGISLRRITECATFYSSFRLRPGGRHAIRVCVGTACHIKGAEDVYNAFRRALGLAVPSRGPEDDTDADALFSVGKAACLGCCMLAVAVQIDNRIYGRVRPGDCEKLLDAFLRATREKPEADADAGAAPPPEDAPGKIGVCLCSGCAAAGSEAVHARAASLVRRYRYDARVADVSCSGMSYRAPLFIVAVGGERYHYPNVGPERVAGILARHCRAGGLIPAVGEKIARLSAAVYESPRAGQAPAKRPGADADDADSARPYEARQIRIVTEGQSESRPLDLAEYKARGGFSALEKAMAMTPEAIVDEIRRAGLRGRGGGGFPTHLKWDAVRRSADSVRYVIANGDEGDPGAFMDRMLLESFPYRVLEGALVAGRVVDASRVILYVREEYGRAVRILRTALDRMAAAGALDSFSRPGFRVDVFTGAGAFVCGEETALIASLEGRRGSPLRRPPYPAERGFAGRPTLINNVETLASVPWILTRGAEAFAAIGTAGGRGAKTFALAGKIRRGGLVEIPMGTTLREILYEVGGGPEPGRRLKAAQIGGPSGGCLPERLFDVPVDFDALAAHGAIMGSGGLVALDDRDCMVDVALYFMRFTASESCGKCSACRIGAQQMIRLLSGLAEGRGRRADLARLRELGRLMKAGSLCNLGRSAPNPVLTALEHFTDEFAAHAEGRCPAGTCRALARFAVSDRCVGCTLCAQRCPADAIAFTPYERSAIDSGRCARCGSCRSLCPAGAVEAVHG